MDDPRAAVPFRWDVARRAQLGRLPRAPVEESGSLAPPPFGWLVSHLRDCAVRTLARAGDARLVFVGRSLESVYDYLSGALADTPWADRCDLLSVSFAWGDAASAPPAAQAALRAHLSALGLAPGQVASAPRPVAMTDLVHGGRTFGRLSDALVDWARDEGVDPAAVRRRVRWVGISVRSKNSPNTWRWFQRCAWTARYPRGALRGLSIPYPFWTYLGDEQAKTMPSNHAGRWTDDAMRRPLHAPEHLRALKLALRVHEHARTPAERAALASALARRPEMREPWLRSLVVALRRSRSA